MQISKNFRWPLVLSALLLPLFFAFSSDVPNSHERAINKLLRSYEREFNLLVPELAKDPKSAKAKDFGSLFFISDSAMVVNHITPDNIKPPKEIATLTDKEALKIKDFLKLASGLYKSDFEYALDRDELVIQALTDNDDEKRFIYQYRLSIPIRVKGKVNGQVVVDFKKDVDMFALVYMDSKRSIKYAKIQAIQYQDGKTIPPVPNDENDENDEPKKEEPKKEEPKKEPNTMDMINWLPAKKQATVLEYAAKAAKGAKEDEIEKMKKDFEVLFDESGFVTLKTKDGQSLRIARKAFLSRATKNKAEYEVLKGTFGKFDQFRQNSRDEYFCRLTTISNATSFENDIPIGTASVAPRMPVKGTAPAREYWKIIELVIQEK
ncbi:hypothetical protein [Runella sp.]|jgi:hypothetical protein|uniref:hypothetical protein n=1 Tax=Runella sp. TaxID=1960881 RepID=UPI0030197A95